MGREAEAMRWLGRNQDGGPALAAEHCAGVLVIGASRSGKTSSLLAPAVTHWYGPVITTSIRDDVIAQTVAKREAAGWPVLVYNPKLEGEYGSSTWSPLTAAMGDKPWVGAIRMAEVLVEAAGRAEGGFNREQDFWNDAAASYVAPLLLAAAQLGSSMEPVMRWLHTIDEVETDARGGFKGYPVREEIRDLLDGYPEARRAAESVWSLYDEARGSIYLTARTTLAAYNDPDALSTCGTAGRGKTVDITPDTVLGTPTTNGATLYLVAPPTNRRHLAPLFTALLTSMMEAAFSRSSGGRLMNPPLLLALDEVANIAPIKELPDYASMAAGSGIQLITVLQDLGQAESIWQQTGTRTLFTNHAAKLIFGGTTDIATLKWVQEMFGEAEMLRYTESFGKGGKSISRTPERRPLLTTDEIRRLPKGAALLVYGRERAAIVTLTPGTTISYPRR
jgi:type IV secretory pathway TraG/TraD family ATPase VirD4